MPYLLQAGLSNALLASVFALLVVIAARVFKHPALMHALWLLVLLKLVTPPLFGLPLLSSPHDPIETRPGGMDLAAGTAVEEGSRAVFQGPEAYDEGLPAPVTGLVQEHSSPETGGQTPMADPSNSVSQATVPTSTKGAASNVINWPTSLTWICVIWIVGSVIRGAYIVRGLLLFRRWLASARSAPQRVVALLPQVAARLRLSHQPQVLVVPGVVTPMVWSPGNRARLLLPERLLPCLDDDQLSTLLAHEMAHIRRGDQWVRLLEVVAGVLYWWHPVVWLAQRNLRRVEEEACDAWVVWALPAQAEAYARAILATVDFLSHDRPRPAPLATGMGDGPILKQRLRNIVAANTPRSFSAPARLSLVCLALVLLPLGLISAANQQQLDSGDESAETIGDEQPAEEEATAPTAQLLGFLRLTDDGIESWAPDGTSVDLPAVDESRLNSNETVAVFRVPENRKVQGYFLKASALLEFPEIWRSSDGETVAFCRVDLPLRRQYGNLLLYVTDSAEQTEGFSFRNVALQPGVPAVQHLEQQSNRYLSDDSPPEPDSGIPDAHRARLPNGVQVELLGVGRFSDGQLQWWSPDGSELEAVAGVLESDVEGYGTVVAARIRGEATTWLAEQEVEGTRRTIDNSAFVHSAGVWLAHVAPASELESGNLILSISGGPAEIVETVPVDGSEDDTYADGIIEEIVKFESTGRESCEVEFRFRDLQRGTRGSDFVGIDQDGNFVESSAGSFGGGGATLTFPVSRERLKAVAVRQRSTHEVRFDDISLKPGHRTEVARSTRELAGEDQAQSPRPAPAAEVVVTGTVTDAATGDPIDDYRLIPGYEFGGRGRILFDSRKARSFNTSAFLFRVAPPDFGGPTEIVQYLRVEAPGYPAQIALIDPEVTPVVIEFQLGKDDGIPGVVQGPDGAPVPDAQVVVCVMSRWTQINNNRISSGDITVRPDENGRFLVSKHDPAFAVLAIHDSGCGLVSLADLKEHGKLVLEPWASVAGVFRIGDEPAANETIEIRLEPMSVRNRGANGDILLQYEVTTDGQGRFEFPRVPGFSGWIARRLILRQFERGFTSTSSPGRHIIIEPGEALTYDFGGGGRVITGRLVAPDSYTEPIDFEWASGDARLQQEPPYPPGLTREEQREWYDEWKTQPDGRTHWLNAHFAGFKIAPDGSFRVDDLPPGTYQLMCRVEQPPPDGRLSSSNDLAVYSGEVTVPPNDGGAIDLGDLELRIVDRE
jgi:beta-lactamase regulating signal transducer with metallopeptidase domain